MRRSVPSLIFAFVMLAAGAFVPAEETKGPKPYSVGGERHGAGFFPLVAYDAVKPKVAGELDFAHYPDNAEVLEILRKWEKEYQNLVTLYSVGKSFEGRDIWQMTITNRATGPDTDKPAMFLEANRHSGEVTGTVSVLYFAHRALSGYGKDPGMTRLLDTSALYVKPRNNPDGAELYLKTAQSNRSTVRPHDDDGDGLLDEDPGEDLDGDGFLLQMRQKVGPGKGTHVVDPGDATGRSMKRVGEGKGDYKTYVEGLDSDGDGKYNEDGIGGLDLHRNYPENWRPEPGRDLTGRGWTQHGAGAYPLSEPETRAVVVFLLEHPHVSVGQTLDTMVPMLLRPPSTSRSEESMFPEDRRIYERFDEEGKKITGYPYAGDVYWTYANLERLWEEETEAKEMKGSPLFGHSPDFGYLYYGAVWYGDELWCAGRVKDYDGDGKITEAETLRWNDEELGGKYFTPWHAFTHPQLGEVEIGGVNPKFFRQNPPPDKLEEWAAKEAEFNLHLARSLPRVKVVSTTVEAVKKEPGVYEIKAVVANEGRLPTALEMAKRVKIVKPDAAELKLDDGTAEIVGGGAVQEIGWLGPGEKREVRWRVKVLDPAKFAAEVAILSTRGGTDRKPATLPAVDR
jgi:hypothetical protein